MNPLPYVDLWSDISGILAEVDRSDRGCWCEKKNSCYVEVLLSTEEQERLVYY